MSHFKAVFADEQQNADMLQFLTNIYHLFPEHKFHDVLLDATLTHETDEDIYKAAQAKLPEIKPLLSELTYALPALREQKAEISRETLPLVAELGGIEGYVEIGSTGRYVSDLRHHVKVEEPIYVINDVAPSYAPPDIVERGQIGKLGTFVDLNNYSPISSEHIPDASVELVTCYIGLHHCPPEKLDGFVKSIARILKPKGVFLMRDHDVRTPDMDRFVSLVHTVFNLGLGVTYDVEAVDHKHLRPADDWARLIEPFGFKDAGARVLQPGDPSQNTLMAFERLAD